MTDKEFKKAKEYADNHPHKFITEKTLEPYIGKMCVVTYGDYGFGFDITVEGLFCKRNISAKFRKFCKRHGLEYDDYGHYCCGEYSIEIENIKDIKLKL